MQPKRLTAKKVRIFDLVNGKFSPGSKEEMKPSYLITSLGQKISRVNIVATIIDKFLSEDENYATITIDDGTETIRVKAFRESVQLIKKFEVGDLILVIGKLKEYAGEIYINAEIVKKVEANYEILRKLEILSELINQRKIAKEIIELSSQLSEEELKEYTSKKFGIGEEELEFMLLNQKAREINYKPKILELIENLDSGEGVEVSKIFEICNLPEQIIENAIDELLASGLLYEPRAGILKKV